MRSLLPLFFVCVTWLVTTSSYAQSAHLEPDTITEGDVSVLVIELQSKIPSLYALDTSALETDFEILDAQSRIITVHQSEETIRKMQWKVDLYPRRTGTLTVPSLKLGGNPTPELSLKVQPQSSRQQNQQQVFLELTANPSNPYRLQQSVITMRLYRNTPITEGRLREPESKNLQIFRSNQDRAYSVIKDGKSFEVIERRIAVTADNSDLIALSESTFRAEIASTSGTSVADRQRRKIFRKSNPLELSVKTEPATYSGEFWLPAESLEISQSWSDDLESVQAGDSINRTIKMTATGLPSEYLPSNLLENSSSQIRVYPDQPEYKNHFDGVMLTGQLTQSFAIVIAESGDIEIPGYHLKWWDTQNEVERTSILPARRIQVSAPLIQSDPMAQPDQPSPVLPHNKHAAILFPLAIVLLCCGLLYLFVHRKPGGFVDEQVLLVFDQSGVARDLKRACLGNRPAEAKKLLQQWFEPKQAAFKQTGQNQTTGARPSPALEYELRRLDASLYQEKTSNWEGKSLWRQLISQHKSDSKNESEPKLTPLYPKAS